MKNQIQEIAADLRRECETADERVAEVADQATKYAAKAGMLSGAMLAASTRLAAIADLMPAAAPARTSLEQLVSISNLLHQAKRQLVAAGHHEAAEDVTEAGLLVWQAISDLSQPAQAVAS